VLYSILGQTGTTIVTIGIVIFSLAAEWLIQRSDKKKLGK